MNTPLDHHHHHGLIHEQLIDILIAMKLKPGSKIRDEFAVRLAASDYFQRHPLTETRANSTVK